jgi:predicted enzyme related to lactoylglutathione lyase
MRSILRLLAGFALTAGLLACTATGDRVTDFPLSEDPLHGKFVWHDLITDDVAAARRFYGDLFGWSFRDTRHPNGGQYVLIMAGSHYVGGIVSLEDPANTEYSRWLGYLSVPDVDRAVELSEQDGGRAVAGPLDLPGIGRAAAVIDPQGAVVGFLRSDVGDRDDSVSPQTGHIVWNELLASDDEAAAEFYAGVSGARARAIQRRGGQYLMLQAQGRDRAGVMMRPGADIEPVAPEPTSPSSDSPQQ